MKRKFIKGVSIAIILLALSVVTYAADQTITFEWDASQDKIAGYNIYSSETGDKPWTKINAKLIVETTYTHTYTELIEAKRWFYIKASDGRNESAPSNIVECPIDTIAPGKVRTLTFSTD